jgi:peroxiredoxin
VVVLGLAVQENVPNPAVKLKAFRKKHRLTYPLLSDEKMEVANQFGVEGVPTLIVLDRQGVYTAHPADVKELSAVVEQLLKKQKGHHREIGCGMPAILFTILLPLLRSRADYPPLANV